MNVESLLKRLTIKVRLPPGAGALVRAPPWELPP